MTTFYGADVDQLRALAAQFQRSAERFDFSVTELNHQAAVATRWEGPDSEAFRGEWRGHGQGAMRSASDVLRDGARQLLENARQQEQASIDSGTTGGPGAGFGSWPGALDSMWKGTLPRDWALWPRGFSFGSTGVFPGGPINPLDIHRWLQDIDGFWHEDTPLFGMQYGDYFKHLPFGSEFAEIVGISQIAFDPDRSTLDKALELGALVTDKAGGMLMDKGAVILAAGGGPVTYLAGLNVRIWTDVIQEANNADLSWSGLQDAATYAWSNPGETIDVFAHAGIETFDKFTGYMGVGWVGDIVSDAAVGVNFSPEQVAESAAYAIQHPDVAIQEVGKAIGQVAVDVGNEVGKAVVHGILGKLKMG